MKTPYLLLFLVMMPLHSICQNVTDLLAQAEETYQNKAFGKSMMLYEKAFRTGKADYSDYYNAACSAALNGQVKQALLWLSKAVDKGYSNIRHMKSDADLTTLRKTREWAALITKLQAKVDRMEVNYDKKLQARLLTVYDNDQQDRFKINEIGEKHGYDSKEMQALWKIIAEKDSLNLLEVKSILDNYGWVGQDKVGGQASVALFLVIQHADLSTQQTYLPLMRKAVEAKKARPSDLALLEDRVALGEGRRQLYGSQIGEDSTGKSYVMALHDPDGVDQRRAMMDLPPLASYVKGWGIIWNVADYKKQLPEIERRDGIKP